MKTCKKRQPNRIINYHNKRVALLKKIDEHLKECGSISFKNFVLEFDMFYSTLYNFWVKGYLVSELVSTAKQFGGKERILISVDWAFVEKERKNLPVMIFGTDYGT